MEYYLWTARIKPGMLDEYRRRHAEIWPEMRDVLHSAGIRNYTIFSDGERVIGYYECAQGAEYAARVQANSEVVARWNRYMEDVMTMQMDAGTGAQPRIPAVWHLD